MNDLFFTDDNCSDDSRLVLSSVESKYLLSGIGCMVGQLLKGMFLDLLVPELKRVEMVMTSANQAGRDWPGFIREFNKRFPELELIILVPDHWIGYGVEICDFEADAVIGYEINYETGMVEFGKPIECAKCQ